MLDPDARPARWRQRQRAADRHSTARSIIIEEGDTDITWRAAPPLQQPVHLLHNFDPQAIPPSKSTDPCNHCFLQLLPLMPPA
jgi:hypothetical protein